MNNSIILLLSLVGLVLQFIIGYKSAKEGIAYIRSDLKRALQG